VQSVPKCKPKVSYCNSCIKYRSVFEILPGERLSGNSQ